MSNTKKINIMILFGGRSAEHEVSILSARSIIAGLNPERYNVIPCAISRGGAWLSTPKALKALEAGVVAEEKDDVVVRPGCGRQAFSVQSADGTLEALDIDVVFPILHGTNGEDGTIQGLFEMAGIPYVGAGVSASSVGMDKVLMKDIWSQAGLPILPYRSFLRSAVEDNLEQVMDACEDTPGYPCFVKPANLGSSVGISRADNREELAASIKLAAKFDRKIIVEQAASKPREIELGVIGNDHPTCSVPGEIQLRTAFYDYETKYWSDATPELIIPAHIDSDVVAYMQSRAALAWTALDLNGLGRMDFMLDANGKVWLNEVNTMPGFTAFSMFSRLWEASGVAYSDLLDTLIEEAFQHFNDRQRNLVAPK